MSTSEAHLPLDPQSRLPRRFGRYALFDFIGKGGMAEIYLARAHTELGASRLCVVKQILSEFALHPQFAEMLIHEAKLAARLNHAHIVQVFDLGREKDQLFIAMEYVEGFDLNALLRRCSSKKVPLPFEFAMRIVSDVLSGLDYAHRRVGDDGKLLGIVHRDVSPSNLLVSLEGEVKLCDFGIAHANDVVFKHSDLQMDEAIKGKAGYMSPEHARAEPIDARADVFAAGIVTWELLAGRRMYRKENDVPLLEQARRAEIPELPKKGLPHEEKLHGIVMKALAPKVADRYASAGAMLRDLDSYMSEARLVASPLKLGDWLMRHFGDELIEQRRARDQIVPLPSTPPPGPASRPSLTPPVAPAARISAIPPAPVARISAIPPAPGLPSVSPVSGVKATSDPPVDPHTIPTRPESFRPPPLVPSVAPPSVAPPDPPSLPASTVDVVPSSNALTKDGAGKRMARMRVLALCIGILGAILVALLTLFPRR